MSSENSAEVKQTETQPVQNTEENKQENQPAEEMAYFIYHPHELWLKGKNRPVFEKQLIDNMRHQLKASGVTNFKVNQMQVEMLVTVPISFVDTVYQVSKKIFGVAVYSRCYKVKREVDLLKQEIGKYITALLAKGPIANFKVETSRVDKRYQTNSMEFSKDIGAFIHDTYNIPVDLKNPALRLNIEIQNDCFFFYSERLEGAGGLPVNTSGKTIVLLSGGFDSPVAAWSVMRRGCQVIYVHFHSSPFGEWRSSVGKVRKIVQQLATWGGPNTFYSVSIGEQQRQIALNAPAKLRVTLYRRLMVRVAAALAKKNKCTALTTGDNLGQVASQTIESMTAIQAAINPLLVLRPLLADSKEEIIEKAARVGTKEISVLPAGDCCSHMLPKKVATKPSIEEAVDGEKNLDVDAMVEAALSGMQVIDINDPWNDEDPDEQPQACPLAFQE